MNVIVETIVRKQNEMALTESELCRRLGISRIYWKMLKTEVRSPGRKFLSGVTIAFPELMPLVMRELQDGHEDNSNGSKPV